MNDFKSVLRRYFGYSDFRGIQREIIESIGAGNDTLGLMPTGGGKSITFQVPALAQLGVCIVITPLIALMKDQVQHLRERNIPAAAIYTGLTRQEIIRTLENCIFGETKFLYISPERLNSELFQNKLRRINVSFITVDEAHCISQWGYDFRPSYLEIKKIRQLKPNAPILALTATATPEVVDDIQEQLGFSHKNVHSMSFERKNLAYVVRKTTDKETEMLHILQSVKGCSIVYARSRKRTKELAKIINDAGISATFYHAGLPSAEKDKRQQAWQDDEKRVMVATNAFGMGIDKPDVHMVIHYDPPSSIEAYFQEAGRGGRDGKKAFAVLLYDLHDMSVLTRRIATAFPEKEIVKQVYEQLAYFYQIGVGSGFGHTFQFDIERFSLTYGYFPTTVDSALRLLTNAGYIHYETDPDSKARLTFCIERDDLYRLKELTPREDAVVTTLLRLYPGLFVDYKYVELAAIAEKSGLPEQDTYMILKSLTQRKILQFIPQRQKPTICYLTNRIDGEKVVLPPAVYENRKEQFTKRISAMQKYMANDQVCRSRQLLEYFGEKQLHDCNACDVCLNNGAGTHDKKQKKQALETIRQMLAPGEPIAIQQIRMLPLPEADVDNAVKYLVDEEEAFIEGAFLKKR